MHIIESIKDNYLICDCCGDRIAPDEVAYEKKDAEGRDIHICIDCENYNNPETDEEVPDVLDDLYESIIREAGRRLSSYSDIELALEFVGQYCGVLDMFKMGFSSNPRAEKLWTACMERFGQDKFYKKRA